jgi:hypothetical protein
MAPILPEWRGLSPGTVTPGHPDSGALTPAIRGLTGSVE